MKDDATKRVVTPAIRPMTDGTSDFETAGEQTILCGRCLQKVTSPDMAVAVNGRHLHHFTNPAGIAFWIRCFSRATGLVILGMPEKEHTWFPGYGWSVAFCTSCSLHLGWFYQSEDNTFFGLIRDNLVEDFTTH